MRILSVVGARPQFIKAGVFQRACNDAGIDHVLVHTGQHYDPRLSQTFFDELSISAPVANLDVGSGSHAQQTGEMMRRFDALLDDLGYKPDWVVVFGDTNSTLAASLVASKRGLPLAHVEAGLRSYDVTMPEERNRVLTDIMSTLLFCPTEQSVLNLAKEGIETGVHLTGDVMHDSLLHYKDLSLERYGHPMKSAPFNLATIHRAENTDTRDRLEKVLACLGESPTSVLWPIHPRTKAKLSDFRLRVPSNVTVVAPIGYLEMLACLMSCDRVFTDSGGLQKEAYWLGKPCITLRSTTEWPETLIDGWNVLVDVDIARFRDAVGREPALASRRVESRQLAASLMVSHLFE